MHHLLRCRCGNVQGQVDLQQAVGRALCYCKSCQAYARFLGRESDILNSLGGTEIIATLPRSVHFTRGTDELACMAVTDKGPLRWYAKCCRTPVGNTARTSKTAYVGLVRACLGGPAASLDERFGPLQIALNSSSARGHVKSTLGPMLVTGLRIVKMIIGARVTGKYRDNPFFVAGSDMPIAKPEGLTATERTALGATA